MSEPPAGDDGVWRPGASPQKHTPPDDAPSASPKPSPLDHVDAEAAARSPDRRKDAQISAEFQRSLHRSIAESRKRTFEGKGKRAKFDIQLDRHEAKYIIPSWMVAEIRDYIRPFCDPDPHGRGDPAEYVITTLQLDSPDLALHHAKENEALNRFKLRVRTYGEPGTSPVFMEVKRKIRGTIVKSRTSIPFDYWSPDLMYNRKIELTFRSRKEEEGFLEFVRLVREIDARPAVLIRYVRESYFSTGDRYARVSFDRKLEYQPTTSWTDWGRSGRWLNMDTSTAQNKGYHFSGVVLELKTLSDTPQWMVNLVVDFSLARKGNCKYSTAIWQEALFRGTPDLPKFATDVLDF